MSYFVIDAVGKPCPIPVMLTKNALKNHSKISCIVDNVSAKENVCNFAKTENCEVNTEEKDGLFYIHITQQKDNKNSVNEVSLSTVIIIGSETLGRGNEELGKILINSFFHALSEQDLLPQTIIFINSGVKLVTDGSSLLNDITNINQKGVEVLACGTCLDYFNIKDKLAVGKISNMYSIMDIILKSQKVISL